MTEYYDEFYDENGNTLYQNTFFHNETIDLMELVDALQSADFAADESNPAPKDIRTKIIFDQQDDQDCGPYFTMRVFYQKPKLTKEQVETLLKEQNIIKYKLKELEKIQNQRDLTPEELLQQVQLGHEFDLIKLKLKKPRVRN